jgi:glyoxylase-like metal-dependent hydrolase (beta-lactamase superfamily II)
VAEAFGLVRQALEPDGYFVTRFQAGKPDRALQTCKLLQKLMKIAERIHILASGSLGTGMSHPNDCNVYGIDCGGEFVLIDTGAGRETETIIENLVSDGIQLGQVRRLFLTHGHLDHSGGASYLRETLKLQVGASRKGLMLSSKAMSDRSASTKPKQRVHTQRTFICAPVP